MARCYSAYIVSRTRNKQGSFDIVASFTGNTQRSVEEQAKSYISERKLENVTIKIEDVTSKYED